MSTRWLDDHTAIRCIAWACPLHHTLSRPCPCAPSMPSSHLQVKVETLVLWGANDEILDSKFAQRFPEELSGCKLVFVKECGHTPHLESAGFVAEQILEFVGASQVRQLELAEAQNARPGEAQ